MTQNLTPTTPENMKLKIQKAGRPVEFQYEQTDNPFLGGNFFVVCMKIEEGVLLTNFNGRWWPAELRLDQIKYYETPDSLSISLDDLQPHESNKPEANISQETEKSEALRSHELNKINYEKEYNKLAEAILNEGYQINEELDLNTSKTQFKSIAKRYDKGFDPENLTFDGVEIKEGDKVELAGNRDDEVIKVDGDLAIVVRDNLIMYLNELNITAHHPAQKSELEEVKADLQTIKDELYSAIFNDPNGDAIEDSEQLFQMLDRYYQARKKLEELQNKNN